VKASLSLSTRLSFRFCSQCLSLGWVAGRTLVAEFCSALCPETWLMQKFDDGIARCNCKGDAEWMAKMSKEAVTVGRHPIT